jgi:hypothetical protein
MVHRLAAPARQRTARRRVSYRVACYPALPRRWDPNPRLGTRSQRSIWKWVLQPPPLPRRLSGFANENPARACAVRWRASTGGAPGTLIGDIHPGRRGPRSSILDTLAYTDLTAEGYAARHAAELTSRLSFAVVSVVRGVQS